MPAALLATALILLARRASSSSTFDVAVYGATPAGIQAALAVVSEGGTAFLASPMAHLGGMMTGGLGATDVGNASAIGGASLAFFVEVCRAYGKPVPREGGCFAFEPHVAEGIFQRIVAGAGPRLTVRLGATLVGAARGSGGGLASISLAPTAAAEAARDAAALRALAAGADVVSASAFIDATYEGDLLAAAGLTTAIGRESREVYNESYAGVLAEPSAVGSHQFKVNVDAIDHSTGLPLPLVSRNPPGAVGSGDAAVQAYNFRLCMTRNQSNRVPFPRPANYQTSDWELARRWFAASNISAFGSLMNLVAIPGGKTDTNNNGPISTDAIGMSWGWPAATPAERRDIFAAHLNYTQGFFWFLQTDSAVPAAVRAEALEWGLAADEFTDSTNWPAQLYVREGRRLVGDFVFRQQDRQKDIRKNDSVGLFSYNIDSHNAQRYVGPGGHALNEGDFELYGGPLGQMPYRAMLSRRAEVAGANVLAPVPLSASHMGYGCLRLEPQLMILGEAAGVAAVQAIAAGVSVQELDVAALQARLRSRGAKIDL